MDIKRILKLAVPWLLIAAAFISCYAFEDEDEQTVYSDISGHWAESAIIEWSDRGVLTGSDGKFRPDDGLTLAELATVISRVVPLGRMAVNNFSDLDTEEWYAEAILKCVAAGIIEQTSGELKPTETLSRERAYVLLSRAVGLEPLEDTSCLDGYNDAGKISEEARPYFAALLTEGIIEASDGLQLYPQEDITRAEVVSMLDKLNDQGHLELSE